MAGEGFIAPGYNAAGTSQAAPPSSQPTPSNEPGASSNAFLASILPESPQYPTPASSNIVIPPSQAAQTPSATSDTQKLGKSVKLSALSKSPKLVTNEKPSDILGAAGLKLSTTLSGLFGQQAQPSQGTMQATSVSPTVTASLGLSPEQMPVKASVTPLPTMTTTPNGLSSFDVKGEFAKPSEAYLSTISGYTTKVGDSQTEMLVKQGIAPDQKTPIVDARDALEYQRQQAVKSGDGRAARYYANELDKLAQNDIRLSSDYHYQSKLTGTNQPTNPYENLGDAALAFIKGGTAKDNLGSSYITSPSVVSPTGVIALLPEHKGTQERDWSQIMGKGAAGVQNFLPAIAAWRSAGGSMGPYGDIGLGSHDQYGRGVPVPAENIAKLPEAYQVAFQKIAAGETIRPTYTYNMPGTMTPVMTPVSAPKPFLSTPQFVSQPSKVESSNFLRSANAAVSSSLGIQPVSAADTGTGGIQFATPEISSPVSTPTPFVSVLAPPSTAPVQSKIDPLTLLGNIVAPVATPLTETVQKVSEPATGIFKTAYTIAVEQPVEQVTTFAAPAIRSFSAPMMSFASPVLETGSDIVSSGLNTASDIGGNIASFGVQSLESGAGTLGTGAEMLGTGLGDLGTGLGDVLLPDMGQSPDSGTQTPDTGNPLEPEKKLDIPEFEKIFPDFRQGEKSKGPKMTYGPQGKEDELGRKEMKEKVSRKLHEFEDEKTPKEKKEKEPEVPEVQEIKKIGHRMFTKEGVVLEDVSKDKPTKIEHRLPPGFIKQEKDTKIKGRVIEGPSIPTYFPEVKSKIKAYTSRVIPVEEKQIRERPSYYGETTGGAKNVTDIIIGNDKGKNKNKDKEKEEKSQGKSEVIKSIKNISGMSSFSAKSMAPSMNLPMSVLASAQSLAPKPVVLPKESNDNKVKKRSFGQIDIGSANRFDIMGKIRSSPSQEAIPIRQRKSKFSVPKISLSLTGIESLIKTKSTKKKHLGRYK